MIVCVVGDGPGGVLEWLHLTKMILFRYFESIYHVESRPSEFPEEMPEKVKKKFIKKSNSLYT